MVEIKTATNPVLIIKSRNHKKTFSKRSIIILYSKRCILFISVTSDCLSLSMIIMQDWERKKKWIDVSYQTIYWSVQEPLTFWAFHLFLNTFSLTFWTDVQSRVKLLNMADMAVEESKNVIWNIKVFYLLFSGLIITKLVKIAT